jgi:hypothetical protein
VIQFPDPMLKMPAVTVAPEESVTELVTRMKYMLAKVPGSRSLRSAGWLYAASCALYVPRSNARLYQSRNCGEVEGQCNLPERGVPVGNTEWQSFPDECKALGARPDSIRGRGASCT